MQNSKPKSISGMECGFDCPLSEDNIEMALSGTPKWLDLMLLISLVITIAYPLHRYSADLVLFSFGAGAILSSPLICLHELSHALVLKILNKDTPIVHLFTTKPRCIPQKPIPLSVLKLDLIAPLWILGVLSVLLFIFIIIDTDESKLLTLVFILIFQVWGSAKDLYWFYKIKNIPNDRYVICDGLSTIIYKNSN